MWSTAPVIDVGKTSNCVLFHIDIGDLNRLGQEKWWENNSIGTVLLSVGWETPTLSPNMLKILSPNMLWSCKSITCVPTFPISSLESNKNNQECLNHSVDKPLRLSAMKSIHVHTAVMFLIVNSELLAIQTHYQVNAYVKSHHYAPC